MNRCIALENLQDLAKHRIFPLRIRTHMASRPRHAFGFNDVPEFIKC